MPKFRLGRVTMTRGVKHSIDNEKITNEQFFDCLRRHAAGDWGDLGEDDKEENEFSLQNDLRILSAYDLGQPYKLHIITEADRSYTTALWADEY